jgi:hypothetical protein
MIESPLRVSERKTRKLLQLSGLSFASGRALWVHEECKKLASQLKEGKLTVEEADSYLEQMGMLDLVYPELMGR